jgi:hypothetical protein
VIAAVGLLPKLAVFVVAMLVGGSVAFVAASAISREPLAPTAGEAPGVLGEAPAQEPGDDPISVAFDLVAAGQEPGVVAGLPPDDLALAAAALLDSSPVTDLNPLGFPRIPPTSQFDGGPFANANCTLAAGAMLARLGWGIVTTGTILRTLQDDQVGGTGLDDLGTALWRGYGVVPQRGLLSPAQLKSLLAAGYGVVIQGVYGVIPGPLRLQAGFTGPHAIYLDGYFPGSGGSQPAYYVIDPLGRPSAGYQGDWWPASIVDDFGLALGHPTRIAASWVFPPGGSPPDVGLVDVPPIPASGGDTPVDSPTPTPDPSASVPPDVVGPVLPEPGDVTVVTPSPGGGVVTPASVGEWVLIPHLLICLTSPPPPGCPGGVEGVFELPPGPILELPLGPKVNVDFVDSSQANVALVGYSVDPNGSAEVRYWREGPSPTTIQATPPWFSMNVFGKVVSVARLDVLASSTYHFQVVAGNGIFSSSSPVGTFTTADGVATFDIALAEVAQPVFDFGFGLSPYIRLATDGLAPPLEPCLAWTNAICQVLPGAFDPTTTVRCSGVADFGGRDLCLGRVDPVAGPTPLVCRQAVVSYELTGIDGTGVLVRAFPGEHGLLPDGGVTMAGILEAEGPPGTGSVSVGCLAPGMTYTIVLDAVGDDRGILAFRELATP